MSATFQDSKITTGPLTEEEPKRNNDFVSKSEEMISTIKRENDSTDDFVRVDPENLFVGGGGGGGGGEGGEIGKKKEEEEEKEEGGGSFGKEPKKGGGEVKAEVEVEVSKEEEKKEEKKEEEEVVAKEEIEEEKKGEKREGEGSAAVEEKLESLPATTTVSSSTTEPPRVQDNHNQHHHHRPGDSTDLKVNTDHQLTGITKRSSFLNEDQVGEEEEEEKALPATPPPSADIEKYDTMADPFQRPASGRTISAEEEGFNPRAAAAATVAFVETERAAASAAAAAVAAAASSAPSPSTQNLSTNGADNTVLLDFSDNTKDSLTSLTTSDQTKMNIDQSLNPITKDTNEKVDDASSNLLDLDSFQSSTTTTTTTTITPPVSLAKVNTDNTDPLSTGNHETVERADDNAVTKNDDKKILDDRFNVEDTSASSSSSVVVDVLPAIAKKDLNDVNVNDVVVAPKTIAAESTTTTTTATKATIIERKDKSNDNTINVDKKSDESETTTIPSKTSPNVTQDIGRKEEVERNFDKSRGKVREFQVAPNEIFRDIGIDAWFNPEILNPKVATLIYWRDPKTTGAVFGAILGLLLSLAYFSLISVLAYLSLLILIGTIAFRIYKSVLQAIQKTSDGHPFKYVLDLDLTLSTEKVHELADISVAHLNAAISELRRLFLVEDIVDSLKFGVLLWCFTYIGSWFNGMTLIIIGFVALFTLPKVYETNKTQIDEHMAMTKERIDEFYAKFKAFIPLFKKPEPTKED